MYTIFRNSTFFLHKTNLYMCSQTQVFFYICVRTQVMNTLNILKHDLVSAHEDPKVINELLNQLKRNEISKTAWPNKNYIGSVDFSISYGEDAIAIKYYVVEETVKAVYNSPNDPVYKDSCVEFFIALDDKSYYNFEFNSNGTCLAQYGTNREDRIFLPASLINNIKSYKSLRTVKTDVNQLISWELTVVIPLSLFINHPYLSLSGNEYRMNFYKCGDDLPEPHYLCWNRVNTENPDFHQPNHFGIGRFVSEQQ
ncbi:hypothetical protein EIM50_17295 [Pseudoxanthomonas sp. SGD-10]|nr:hypothetical protein EIM50_17295 [Pseudoxanthomonas sp. SGD-10]